MVRMSLVYH